MSSTSDIKLDILLSSCKYGDYKNFSKVIRVVCDNKADVNYFNGYVTPLTVAFHHKNFHIAKYLLNVPGIDVNKPDVYGQTPLHFCCFHNNVDLLRMILKNHPQISMNMVDMYGRSPLLVAVDLDNIDIKDARVDLRLRNCKGKTALEMAKYKILIFW